VAGPFDKPPEVSLAHTGPLAAALVGHPGTPSGVGIDIERIEDRDDRTVAAILTDAERGLIDHLCPSGPSRSAWVTRFWAAKEAIAKAAGTGLGGRPHRFAIERIDGEPEPYAAAWTSPEIPDRVLHQTRAHTRGQPDDG
jgi:phosphopantetheinyl transferase